MLLLTAAWLVVAAAVEVELLTGDALAGQAVSVAGDQLMVDGRAVALVDVDQIRMGPVGNALASSPLAAVLGDGSWFPLTRLPTVAGPDRLRLDGPLGQVELELGQVLAWGPTEWLEQRWATVHSAAGDDVVLVEDAEVTGRIDGADANGVAVTGSLGALTMTWERVGGAILALPVEPPQGVHLLVTPVAGMAATAVQLTDHGAVLALAPDAGVLATVAWPLVVEGGRRRWLSALEPVEVVESGHFGVTWPHSRDQDLDGAAIMLAGVRRARGLVIHSDARLVWALDGQYERLQAMVGIVDAVRPHGDCLVTVRLDGSVIWERERFQGTGGVRELSIACAGAQRLEIVVAAGERFDIGDHLVLGDAWLLAAASD